MGLTLIWGPTYTHWLVNKLHGSHHDQFRFQQFEIVELPTIYRLITKKENGKRTIEEKSSIRHLIELLN
jgi:hypothetical protein